MDFQNILKQAQAMQSNLTKINEELNNKTYEGNNGGSQGVTVKVSGANEILEVNISEDLLEKDNKEMLQDMIMLATNDALNKALKEKEEKLGNATQGISIPGL